VICYTKIHTLNNTTKYFINYFWIIINILSTIDRTP